MNNTSDFPVMLSMPVIWGDLDPHGHVNNVIYFRYFEAVRVEYFRAIGLLKMQSENGIGSILKETACSFKKPIRFPDTVTVSARTTNLSNSSITMEYRLEGQNSGLVAIGTSVTVIYDYNAKKKTAIPDSLRNAIMEIEGKNF